MQRIATLFARTGASSPALANNSYPTALSAALGEEQVYHPGLYDLYPAQARVTRHAAGVASKLKFQGTSDPPNPLSIGAGDAQLSLVAVVPGQLIQLVQGVGASVSISHVTSAGLTTLTLGTDARSRPSTTPTLALDYIVANLAAVFSTTLSSASGSGILGAMLRAATVPEAPRWVDIESTRQNTGTTAHEHTIDPGAGASADVGFLVKTGGWRAIRCVATGTGAPNAADAVAATMGLPG